MRHAWGVGVIALLSFGWSHPDIRVADEAFALEPGAVRTFPMAVHYHRLVGTASVEGVAPDDVAILVVEDSAWRPRSSDVLPARAEFAATGGETRVLNHLIRCCDVGYTDYRLIVRNEGANPLQVVLSVWAVHDDFAVVVDRAEAGAFGVPATIFGVLSGFALAVAARRRREDVAAGRDPLGVERRTSLASGEDAPAALRWSVAMASIAMAVALGLGVTGALRYASDPVTGMMSVLADVPVPGGPFGSRAAMVMGILLVAWCAAIGTWIRALATARRGPVRAVGMVLGLISLAGGVAMGSAYGAQAVPGMLGVILGVPLIAAAWWVGPVRGPGRRAPATVGR